MIAPAAWPFVDRTGPGGLFMTRGGAAAQLCTRGDLLSRIRDAASWMTEIYVSDTMIISRVVTKDAGTYYFVVESDLLEEEDQHALAELSALLGAKWRACLLSSERYGSRHVRLPWAASYAIHVVHPEALWAT